MPNTHGSSSQVTDEERAEEPGDDMERVRKPDDTFGDLNFDEVAKMMEGLRADVALLES